MLFPLTKTKQRYKTLGFSTAIIFFALVIFFVSPGVAHAQSCGTDLGCYFAEFGTKLFGYMVNALMVVASYITGWAGVLLNQTIQYTLVDMSQNISQISAITIAWGVIRDLINMSFIFILLYIAIGTILDIGVNWKSTLVKVIIAAVLINFSMFFTRTVIDVSNILALTFYNQIIPAGSTAGGIADAIAGPLKITTLYNNVSGNSITFTGITVVGVMGIIFLLVTAFVFLAVTLLFISRFVTLIFVLILSPIGFFGSVLPGLGGAAKKWRDTLIGQAIFAPIYMILTWIVLVIINDPTFLTGSAGNLGDLISGTTHGGLTGAAFSQNNWQIFVNFIIVICFMIATLVISKGAASQGSNLGQKLTGSLLGYGTATAGFVGRNTIGRGASRFMKSKYGTALQAREDSSRLAQLGLKMGRAAQTSSFDVRATKIAQKAGNESGVSLGSAGGQGGFVDQKKKLDEFFGRPGSQAAKERSERARQAQNKQAVTGGSSAAAIPRAIRTPAQQVDADKLERALGQMSPKAVEQMSHKDLSKPGVAQNLSPQQFDAVMKSDRFTDREREAIRDVRFNTITSAVAGGAAPTAKDDIRALKTSELEHLEPSMLTNQSFVEQLSDSQVEEIAKSSRFTKTQQEFVKNARIQPIVDGLDSSHPSFTPATAAASIAKLKAMNPKNLSKIGSKTVPHPTTGAPVAILVHPDMLPTYTPAKLKRLASELSDGQIQDVRSAILSAGATPGTPMAATAAWLITPDGLSSFN